MTMPGPSRIHDTSGRDSRIPDTSGQDSVLTPASRVPRRLRRWLPLGAAAALIVAALVWVVVGRAAGGRSYDASRLRFATVERGDMVRDISADGRVIAANSPTLYAIAGGTVTLNVVAGDVVEEGQALAEIDSPELRSELVQEESTLASLQSEADRAALDARIAHAAAQKLLDQAEIEHVAALRDEERYQRAFDEGVVPQIDLARAQDALKKAEIGLAAARQEYELQSQGTGLDTRNKQLLAERHQAVVAELRRQVEALTLRAPFDGQVGQVHVAHRSNVADNAPVLSVVDLSVFEVEIEVPEGFARDLDIGMPAEILSGTKTWPAEVSAVSPEVVNGEVSARLRFSDEQPPGLRQNQRLSARILLDRREDVLMVERGPFLEQGGGRFAWVVDRGSAVRRPIRTGVASLNAVEILEGLREGERIVVSGADHFDNADRVRISGD